MKQTIILSMAVLSLLSIQSCSTEFDNDIKNISVTSGNADFSHYVASLRATEMELFTKKVSWSLILQSLLSK